MSDKSPPGICGLSCLKVMNADIYCRSQDDGVPQGAEKLIRSSYGHSAECSGYIRGLLRKPVRDQRLFTEAPNALSRHLIRRSSLKGFLRKSNAAVLVAEESTPSSESALIKIIGLR